MKPKYPDRDTDTWCCWHNKHHPARVSCHSRCSVLFVFFCLVDVFLHPIAAKEDLYHLDWNPPPGCRRRVFGSLCGCSAHPSLITLSITHLVPWSQVFFQAYDITAHFKHQRGKKTYSRPPQSKSLGESWLLYSDAYPITASKCVCVCVCTLTPCH